MPAPITVLDMRVFKMSNPLCVPHPLGCPRPLAGAPAPAYVPHPIGCPRPLAARCGASNAPRRCSALRNVVGAIALLVL